MIFVQTEHFGRNRVVYLFQTLYLVPFEIGMPVTKGTESSHITECVIGKHPI